MAKSTVELTGQQFGRWLVLHLTEKSANGKRRWLCRCECGKESAVYQRDLLIGDSRSCGARHERPMSATPGYQSWAHMIRRCTNPEDDSYERYGGRGITVCDRWLESFRNFLADMGERPEGKTLDRINNSGPYEPGNCRWATSVEQQNNTRRNRIVEIDGVSMPLMQAARERGISYTAARSRVWRGRPL